MAKKLNEKGVSPELVQAEARIEATKVAIAQALIQRNTLPKSATDEEKAAVGEFVIDNIRVYGFLEHDGDLDGDRDLADFAVMQRCFGAGTDSDDPLPDECWPFDVDGDGRVNAADYLGGVVRIQDHLPKTREADIDRAGYEGRQVGKHRFEGFIDVFCADGRDSCVEGGPTMPGIP